jgi:hypothetical protein
VLLSVTSTLAYHLQKCKEPTIRVGRAWMLALEPLMFLHSKGKARPCTQIKTRAEVADSGWQANAGKLTMVPNELPP